VDLDSAGYRVRQQQATSQALSQFRFGLERNINTAFMATSWMDIYWPGQSFSAPQGLTAWANTVLKALPYMRSIGVAEGYVLSHLFPEDGNQAAVGFDYRHSPEQWPEVQALIESGEPRVAGPLELMQGGNGIIYRNLLLDEQGQFAGVASMVLDTATLFAQSGLEQAQSELQLAIRGRDGKGADGEVFLGDPELFAGAHTLTQNVVFPGGEWQLAAAPLGGWSQTSPNTARLKLAGGLVSILLVISTFFAVRNSGRKQERSREYRQQLRAEVEQRTRDLERARERAEAANDAKSRFLAAVTHELRTPLTAIIGLNQLAREPELPQGTRKDYLDRIAVSAQLLLGLINDILSYAKIESGQDSLRSRSFSLAGLAEKLHSIFDVSCAQKGLTLTIGIDAALPAWVCGDDERLLQVLANLVGNAIKFTDKGCVRIAITRLSAARVEFSVSDTGLGIDPAQQDRLFQPFVQAHGELGRHFDGSGLGLSIAQRQVQRMGGLIALESTPGQGSRFYFELALPAASSPAAPTPARIVARPQFDSLRLLVAEDNPVLQLLLGKLLERAGISYRVVDNGQQALDALAQERFDGLLMDIQMPVLDGLQTSLKIRSGPHPDLPIIALSANAMEEDRTRALAAGINDFVAKPIDTDEFYAVLERRFGRSDAGR
ncbi:MAG: ATP-binding protein, partial [Spongiibacteraceae bacterium]|jgi:signal transduction histidine kinase/ActR/RegA family two-component response regulator|nr:ATP-binding protein [Spongiibacteraceae bacterium]